MAYVIVTTRPEELKGVFGKHSFASEAQWCTERGSLSSLLPAISGENSFVFVDFENKDFFTSSLELVKALPRFKLIYFCQEFSSHILRDHQGSALGGDVYLPWNVSGEDMTEIIEALTPKEMNIEGSRLETHTFSIFKKYGFDDVDSLSRWKDSTSSRNIDHLFQSVISQKKVSFQSVSSFSPPVEDEEIIEEETSLSEDEDMSDKDKELSLDDLGDLELGADANLEASGESEEDGFDLNLSEDESLDLSEGDDIPEASLDDSNDFNLDDGDADADFSLGEDDSFLNTPEEESEGLSLSDDDDLSNLDDLSLSEGDDDLGFSLGEDDAEEAPSLPDLGAQEASGSIDLDDDLSFDSESSTDLSDEAMEKLKEIDEMMGDPINESLVSDDLDIGSLDLSQDEDLFAAPEVKKTTPKKKKEVEEEPSRGRSVDQDIKQIVGNYSGEMERLAATLSNLRSDREELLGKIQKLEEEKMLQQRQNLSLRAELDEKKIELTIIKKKLNEENNELKDKLKIQEEIKLIWEERNKQLQSEVEKISQKTRIDVKKVQGRERELEQKLELLKADAETQIRHRDQKILELKRRVDGMEFDMESMGHQEKKSLDGKVELEQKLDKAIRTLRGAISILENDSEAAQVLEKLKKNIEV